MLLDSKKRHKKDNKNSGFSLIEILLSLTILFMIIGGVVVFSVRTIENHTKSQAMQNAMDNARFAIEGLSKKIRTSSDINGSGSEIFFVDNVDGSKYCYQFGTNAEGEDVLQVKKYAYVEGDAGYDAIKECDYITSPNDFEELVGGGNLSVSGAFDIKETDNDLYKRGFVRIMVNINYDGGDVAEQDSVKIQTGVSLRDY